MHGTGKAPSCAWLCLVLVLVLYLGEASGFVLPRRAAPWTSTSELHLIRRILRRLRNKAEPVAPVALVAPISNPPKKPILSLLGRVSVV
jgi:hypothetical protein